MEANEDTLRAAREACDGLSGNYAPRVVIEALLTLTGGATPSRGLAQSVEMEGTTTWRALWLTGQQLAYVEATKAEGVWDLATHRHSRADAISGWLRPLRDLSRLSVTDVSDPDRDFGAGWSWDAETALTFTDGATVSLPLSGGLTSTRHVQAAEDFLGAVRDAWTD